MCYRVMTHYRLHTVHTAVLLILIYPGMQGLSWTEGPLLSQKRLHLPTPKGCATSGLTPPGTDASNGAEQTRARSKEGGGATNPRDGPPRTAGRERWHEGSEADKRQ